MCFVRITSVSDLDSIQFPPINVGNESWIGRVRTQREQREGVNASFDKCTHKLNDKPKQ